VSRFKVFGLYKIEQTSNGFIVWQRNYDGSWERQYFLIYQPHKFPESMKQLVNIIRHPHNQALRAKALSAGQPHLTAGLARGWKIDPHHEWQRIERRFESQQEYQMLLKEYFGIVL